VLILPPDTGADAKMRMFNLDGSEGSMSGNAIRCVAKYLYDNGIVNKREMQIETKSGVKKLYLSTRNQVVSSVKVDMGRAELRPKQIPVNLEGENVIKRKVIIGGADYEITCVSMGNPHAVVFKKRLDDLDLEAIGPLIENDLLLFPDRVNVEFVNVMDRNHLEIRIWERGSGETQASGTSACSSAVAAVLNGYCDKGADIRVRLPGGELIVNYTDDAVWLTGDCVKVFDGTVEI